MSRLTRWHLRVTGSARDRGDVPGWVLVTVMTAALVSALFLIARPRLTTLLGDALDGVLGG
jgi:hypothetical protein